MPQLPKFYESDLKYYFDDYNAEDAIYTSVQVVGRGSTEGPKKVTTPPAPVRVIYRTWREQVGDADVPRYETRSQVIVQSHQVPNPSTDDRFVIRGLTYKVMDYDVKSTGVTDIMLKE